jgi:hypothetical protein
MDTHSFLLVLLIVLYEEQEKLAIVARLRDDHDIFYGQQQQQGCIIERTKEPENMLLTSHSSYIHAMFLFMHRTTSHRDFRMIKV